MHLAEPFSEVEVQGEAAELFKVLLVDEVDHEVAELADKKLFLRDLSP